MAWKGVHLTRPAHLKLKQNQLLVVQDDSEVTIAMEDIAWIVLDTQQTTLTGAVLAACMDCGIAIITCDRTHTPSGLALPFHGHHKQAAVANSQIAMSRPVKKRLWQTMVRAKIENQARVLRLTNSEGADQLVTFARLVRSGDPDNLEARAARHYWSCLFVQFRRSDDSDRRNKLLNYGYAIVRSAVARSLVAHGLLPAFGVGHANASNAFNLADDLVEPFRPFVDRLTVRLAGSPAETSEPLTREDRQTLAGLLQKNARFGPQTVSLLVAAEQAAASLARAALDNNHDHLVLPQIAE